MKIAVLTSSRADFGFYTPLLKKLIAEKNFNVKLIAFGTHLSKKHGNTIDQIKSEGFKIFRKLETQPKGDKAEDISTAIGEVHMKFSKFWSKNQFDLIICLGDRYEMFAAVSASVPFGIKIIHISGGEETLGAIDNVYRHALTLMADIHFTNTKGNALRVQQIKGSTKNIYHTGSLAIDNIRQTKLLSAKEFQLKFNFDIEEPFVLFTFHPETVNHKLNITYSEVLKKVLIALKENVLVTMPNADTMGNTIRIKLKEAAMQSGKIKLIESLGSSGYYTALSKCKFVMGNSSSGIVEAASFGKYVLNIGDRQKGRERGKNIIDVPVDLKRILHCTKDIIKKRNDIASNIYGDGKAAKRMLAVIKHIKGYSYE